MTTEAFVVDFFMMGLCGFVCGLLVGKLLERHWWRGEMIERRHAMYHYYDGKWYWNEDVPKAKDPIADKVRKWDLESGGKTERGTI